MPGDLEKIRKLKVYEIFDSIGSWSREALLFYSFMNYYRNKKCLFFKIHKENRWSTKTNLSNTSSKKHFKSNFSISPNISEKMPSFSAIVDTINARIKASLARYDAEKESVMST